MSGTARSAVDRESIARRLERWYRANARDLPWRTPGTRSAYAALVSEAMLQQTQVSRVVDAFLAFMRRFPDVDALAAADEQEVLAAWTGLGYYRRARHLHAAAKRIVAEHGSQVPRELETLRTLPGVGRYTAGAIASIVFGEPTPIVDGNVARVLLRLHGRALAADDPEALRWTWHEAERLVDAAQAPGTLNEGLMELGAVVCTPRSPKCAACPLASTCAARRDGIAEAIPPPKSRAARRIVHHHAVIVAHGGRLLIERRGDGGLWASMWQVPTVEHASGLAAPALRRRLAAAGLEVESLESVTRFTHLTTHREVRFRVLRASTRQRRGTWATPDEALERPMSAPMRRIVMMAPQRL